MRLILSLLALASLPLLHGCAAVVIGGAATTGYLIGEDRRPAAAMADDTAIEMKASPRISDKFPDAHVNTTSYNKLLLLTGEASNSEAKAEIEKIARGVEGVRGIYNEIKIGPTSTLGARANDSLITSKVKARFVDSGKFNAVHVKVVTEAGTVYLMGLVKRQEANDATEVARTTSGVQRVVRVFEYQE